MGAEAQVPSPVPSRYVARNRLVMLRYLEMQSVEEIADAMGMEPSSVSAILGRPEVRAEMDQLSQTTVQRVTNLADEAIDKVRETMRGRSNSELQFKAAKDLLDRNPELNPKQPGGVKEMAEGLAEGLIRAIGKEKAVERPLDAVVDMVG